MSGGRSWDDLYTGFFVVYGLVFLGLVTFLGLVAGGGWWVLHHIFLWLR